MCSTLFIFSLLTFSIQSEPCPIRSLTLSYANTQPIVINLPNDAFTASTVFSTDHEAYQVRSNTIGSWTPQKEEEQWIKIDLQNLYYIYSISTFGSYTLLDWTTQYQIQYSLNSFDWFFVCNSTNIELIGNFDRRTEVFQNFPIPFQARYIQINPTNWSIFPAMRIEVYALNDTFLPTIIPTNIPTNMPIIETTSTLTSTQTTTQIPTQSPNKIPIETTSTTSLKTTSNPTSIPTVSPYQTTQITTKSIITTKNEGSNNNGTSKQQNNGIKWWVVLVIIIGCILFIILIVFVYKYSKIKSQTNDVVARNDEDSGNDDTRLINNTN